MISEKINPTMPPGNITHAGKGTFVQDSATLDGLRIKLVSFQVASVRAAAMVQEREVGAAFCQGGIGVLVDLLPVLAHGRGNAEVVAAVHGARAASR